MGHQFYKRLAGEQATIFDIELDRPVPDITFLADVGAKSAFYRVRQLDASGDLARILNIVRNVIQNPNVAQWSREVPASLSAAVNERVKSAGCIYPSEAGIVAQQFLRTLVRGEICNMAVLVETTARVFADQISRSEAVYRLPSYGLADAQMVAHDITAEITARAATSALKPPSGKRTKSGHKRKISAPRTRARRKNSKDSGNDIDF